MVGTTEGKDGNSQPGAHRPSTLHLRLQRGPPSSPVARDRTRAKLRHVPQSQLKPRHRTDYSLLTQGDPRTGRYSLDPLPTLSWPRLPGEKDRIWESGCGIQHGVGGRWKGHPCAYRGSKPRAEM